MHQPAANRASGHFWHYGRARTLGPWANKNRCDSREGMSENRRRAGQLREHASRLRDQAAQERRQDRARYIRDQAAVFERAAALLEERPAPTLVVSKTKAAGGGWRL